MKSILFCVLSILLITGCSKEEEVIENNGLLGKWKLKEEWWSPGDNKIVWSPVEKNKQSVIEFRFDSTFIFSSNFQKADLQLNRYQLTGDELNMSSTINSNTDKWYVYFVDNKLLELTIFRCIEGCLYRFVPTK